MGRRVLSIAFATSLCLLAAHTSRADSIDFQTAVASGGSQTGDAQTLQGAWRETAQSGGASSAQTGGGAGGTQVQTVDIGDVTGTVCDCGEITPATTDFPAAAGKGGFPKFPLFAFAAGAPTLCFFSGLCTSNPPNPPEVPEPMTLATLAAGLAALARLRARRGK